MDRKLCHSEDVHILGGRGGDGMVMIGCLGWILLRYGLDGFCLGGDGWKEEMAPEKDNMLCSDGLGAFGAVSWDSAGATVEIAGVWDDCCLK